MVGTRDWLICRTHTERCGIPISLVGEVMRPLPTSPLQSAQPAVSGVAKIRGIATPVVHVARLLFGAGAEPGRYVTLRAPGRQVALAFDSVLGVRALPIEVESRLPALVEAEHPSLQLVASRGRGLLFLLADARWIPEEAWATLEEVEAPRG
jgi:purine-binding chemotaxis protein CheW